MRTLLALVAGILTIGAPVHAGVVTLVYSGTVNAVFDYPGGTEPPAGVAIGAVVSGRITYDSGQADEPTYAYTSCSGSACAGSFATARYALGAPFSHSVTIDGQSWDSGPGSLWMNNALGALPAPRQNVGFDDGDASGRFATLAVAFSGTPGVIGLLPAELPFGALLSTIAIDFAAATSGSGWIALGDDGYYIGFTTGAPTAVPAPPAALLLLTGCAAWIARATVRTGSSPGSPRCAAAAG